MNFMETELELIAESYLTSGGWGRGMMVGVWHNKVPCRSKFQISKSRPTYPKMGICEAYCSTSVKCYAKLKGFI